NPTAAPDPLPFAYRGQDVSSDGGIMPRSLPALATMFVFWLVSAHAAGAAWTPPLLLADDSRRPKVTVVWPTRDGEEIRLQGTRPFRSPGDKKPLGHNIHAYVALGGTRVDRGLGDPDG